MATETIDITPHMRREAIAAHIANDVKGLLEDYLEKIEEFAAESDPDGEKPVKAKVRFSTEWEAGSKDPKINTKIAFILNAKDEVEGCCETMQATMSFKEG